MWSLLLCCWKRVLAMTSEFSWQNSVSLCPASFRTPRPNLPVTLGISWLSTSAFQSPMLKRTSFFGVSSKKSSRYFIESFNFSFFSISGWGIDLDYCHIEWFALKMNRDHSVIFEIAPKYCILDYFVDNERYFIFSKQFLPTVVHTMVFGIKSIPVHFSSLISKILMLLLPSPVWPLPICLDSWT